MGKGFSTQVISRHWRLIELIRQELNRDEIMAELDIPSAQLTRDVKDLNESGYEVRYRKASNSYEMFFESGRFRFELDEKELFLMLSVSSRLAEEDELYKSLDEKLKSAARFTDDIFLDLSASPLTVHEEDPEHKKMLNKLIGAIKNKKNVCFSYKPIWKPEQNREISPQKIIHSAGFYYVYGYCHYMKSPRIFKFNRLQDLRLSQSKKGYVGEIPQETADRWVRNAWFLSGGETQTVKVRLWGYGALIVKELPALHGRKILEDEDNRLLVTWQVANLWEFASWLLQWLGDFEVLESRELKEIIEQKVKRHLSQLNKEKE